MRAYHMLVLASLVIVVGFGAFLSASPTSVPSITAEVDIVPEVFNVKRMDAHGGVITAYISNLIEDDVHDINISTVWLEIRLENREEKIVKATRAAIEDDILIVKFDATQVAAYIWTTIVYHMDAIPPQEDYSVTFSVTGQLINGEKDFAGDDTVKIIYYP